MINEFDQFVLQSLPHFVAVEYQSLLDADTAESKIRHALRVYQLGLRALAIGIVSQYLIRDAHRVNDPELNQLLGDKLRFATIDTWQKILFTSLKAYRGLRSLFFMPELYDFFWDSSSATPRPRPEVEKSFARLTQIYNDVEFGKEHIDWSVLCDETLGLLQELFGHFVFFRNYELIRVIKREENQYWYERHTGLETDAAPLSFETERDLVEGWFYLARQNQDFLDLHPLLIFWEDSQLGPSTTTDKQFAIYERFVSDRLQYLLTSPWKTVMEDKSVADFVRIVYYTLKQIKGEIPEAARLTWEQLQTIARIVSNQRMASVLDKYNPNLYLKRDNTISAFEDFLVSDKICFVLTGKSGVGKSNFLLALADEYNQTHPEICVLMYNGAKLAADKPLAVAIGQDFDTHLKLTRPSKPNHIDSIWQEIAAIDDITSHQVILFIDAINENSEAKALLRQIDDLVESAPWPWLKVVITSRPEAWRTIKRGVRLAETRYFRAASGEQLGIEMQSFSYSQQLESFTRDELPRAYTKYQAVYHLQSIFSDLSAEVRASLQDPLVLRLVAVTYHDQAIPATIKISQIYQNYIDHLIASERMTLEDVRFLEQELLPLMLHEGHYANALSGREIDTARTTDGHSLFELIHGEGMLSNGRRVNQSYVNLVDTEILVRHDTGRDYEIGFKYERFYDYYAGQQLHRLSTNRIEVDPYVFFLKLINETKERPFLWGAIRTALLQRVLDGQEELLLNLCFTPEPLCKEMGIAILLGYRMNASKEIEPILLRLMGAIYKDIVRGKSAEQRAAAKSIAIEVAAELGFVNILNLALRDSSSGTRANAVQYGYYLWKKDHLRGFEILKSLSRDIRGRWGIPNTQILESCIGYSALILFDNYKDANIRSALQQIWRDIIRHLLPFATKDLHGFASRNLRSILVFIGTRILTRILRSIPYTYVFNMGEIEYFFRTKAKRSHVIAQLIPYIDPYYGAIEDLENILRSAITSFNDLITEILIVAILTSRLILQEERTSPLIRNLYKVISNVDPIPLNIHALGWPMGYVLPRQNPPGELFDLFEELVWNLWDRSRARYSTEMRTYKGLAGNIAPYVALYEQKHNNEFPPRITSALQEAFKKRDVEFAEDYLAGLVELAGGGYITAVFHALEPILKFPGDGFENSLLTTLARIRTVYPDEVDNFLETHDFSDNLRERIKSHTTSETIGDLMALRGASFGMNALLIEFPEMRSEIQWVFQTALDSSNSNQWFERIFMRIANIVYGEELFEVPVRQKIR